LKQDSVIIVAGGTGKRMNAGIPKQFLLLHGEPVLMHTLRAFHTYDPALSIVLALPESHISTWKDLCRMHDFTVPHLVVTGGNTRTGSVKNALKAVKTDGLVAIHDGARPLVSPGLILTTFTDAEQYGNAIPVLPVAESLREMDHGKSFPVDRTRFRIVQTPQVFRTELIKNAYAKAPGHDYSDDATVLELTGEPLRFVEGDPWNIKITVMADMEMAEVFLK
jgi:2-C-methyl-D-erythritol 4-phosphate cytidylyltransferase